MTDNTSKILLENKNPTDIYGTLIPTYLRSSNSIIKVIEKINKISWEKEGVEVIIVLL